MFLFKIEKREYLDKSDNQKWRLSAHDSLLLFKERIEKPIEAKTERNYLKIMPAVIEQAIKLKQTEEQNKLLTEYQKAILANSFDAIVIADLKGTIIYFNDMLVSLSKYPDRRLAWM